MWYFSDMYWGQDLISGVYNAAISNMDASYGPVGEVGGSLVFKGLSDSGAEVSDLQLDHSFTMLFQVYAFITNAVLVS